MTKPYHDQVIEAAYLHTKPGVFYIGPFARRVSFESQQRRALDLFAALKAKQKLHHRATHRPKTVAVVGAGVAGITMANALRGEACIVHLYEREEEPLLLQCHASHRLIHPTISRWPAGKLELTTRFAFLDWFAAPADRVVANMRREWEELLKPSENDRGFRFLNKVTVTGIRPDAGTVRLQTETQRDDVPKFQRYDYVFVTTGFAEEETLGDHPSVSYWNLDDDEIDVWRENQTEVFISGCGDGGLIDALRLIHADFDRGWLVIRLAALLDGIFDDEILEAESDALMAAKSLACMELTDQRDEERTGHSNRKVGARYESDDIVRDLEAFYRDLARRLPPGAQALLDASIATSGVQLGKVTLVSRQLAPFGPYAAPIHKIMIAHGLEYGPLDYMQGELRIEKEETIVERIAERIRTRVTPKMGLVVRHGSPANLQGLASIAESNSLRIRQFMLADYIDHDLDQAILPPPGYPAKESELGRYIGIRRHKAEEIVDALVPGATVTASRTGFTYEPPVLAPLDQKPVGLDVPKSLFGLDLDESMMIEIDHLG